MRILLWLTFLFSFYLQGNVHALICGLVTPFDALCSKNNTIYVLSTQPCLSEHDVYLTIIRTDSNYVYHKNFSEDVHTPIKVANELNGVVIDFYNKPGQNGQVFKNSIHVTLKLVAIFANGSQHGHDYKDIMDVDFSLRKDKCRDQYFKEHNEPVVNQSYCDYYLQLGSYSTLCNKKNEASYFTFVNVCSIPYSVKLVAINTKDKIYVSKTVDRINEKSFIHVKVPGQLGGECGMKLEKFVTSGSQYQMLDIETVYFCENTPLRKGETIVKRRHETAFGMMCQQPLCNKLEPNKYKCTIKDIMEDALHGMHNATVEMDCNICNKTLYKCKTLTTVTSHTTGENNALDFTFGSKNITVHFVGAEINLTVFRDEKSKLYTTLFLVRELNDVAYPFLRHDFYLTDEKCGDKGKDKVSSKSSPSNLAVKIVVPIVVILLLIVVAYFLYKYWQKKRLQKYGHGLPYNIELGDDDFDMKL